MARRASQVWPSLGAAVRTRPAEPLAKAPAREREWAVPQRRGRPGARPEPAVTVRRVLPPRAPSHQRPGRARVARSRREARRILSSAWRYSESWRACFVRAGGPRACRRLSVEGDLRCARWATNQRRKECRSERDADELEEELATGALRRRHREREQRERCTGGGRNRPEQHHASRLSLHGGDR